MKLTLEETLKFSDFIAYVFLTIKEGLFLWIFSILIIKFFKGKSSDIVVIKNDKKIIGGFCLTDFPVVKYSPYNLFNKKVRRKIDELVKNGYQHFCFFVVKKQFRNMGVGTFAFDSYLKKNHKRIWFVSYPKAENFYLRNGAKLFYKSRYNIYVLNIY